MKKTEQLLDDGKFKRALARLKESGPASGPAADRFLLKGEALRGLGLFAAAIKEYGAARSAPGGRRLAAFLGEARCHRALGNKHKALSSAKKALELSKTDGGFKDEARLEWALALRLTGRLGEAAGLLVKILRDYKKAGDRGGAAFALWALGGLYRLQGRYAEGITAFENSFALAKKAGDQASAGYALFGLGGILRVAGFMGRALDCYARARKSFAATDDTFAKAYAECGTANVLRQLGRLEEALAGYERAHRLYSGLSDWADLGFVEWGMGEIRRRGGDFPGALKNYRSAMKLFKGRGEPRGEALTLLSLSYLYYLTGAADRAEKSHAAALRFIQSHGLHTHLETFT
ncbi:MAG: hypothetical protein COT18_11020 [Elusimicrobia bacterium CG08_land_8_20_14_0_20_59_10]|nr:MAG: hypothetical protein COT18_11020 [Elusimicrobia bacterium CG08_land_8_20_14_0_20_59_10]